MTNGWKNLASDHGKAVPAGASSLVVRSPDAGCAFGSYLNLGQKMRASMAESIRIPTREDGPFHTLKPEYARHTLDAALGSGLITDEDARLIEEFVAELRATPGIGVSRSNRSPPASRYGGGS